MKNKLKLVASAGILAFSIFTVPTYADAPICDNISTETNLRTCIDANLPIKLGADVALTSSVVIKGGHNIAIDMNGKTLTRDGNSVAFEVRKGTLSLEGNGTLKRTGIDPNNSRAVIRINGETTPQTSPTSILSVGEGITLENNDDAAILVEDRENGSIYGIEINFAGKSDAIEGIVVDNTFNDINDVPKINIKDSAKITAENHAILATGYADWNIGAAELTANSGLALVQGRFYIDGTFINATGEDNSALYPNGEIARMPLTGAAIQVQSTKNKTDKSSIYIKSGFLSSENGYVIAEYAADEASKSTTIKDFKIYTATLHGSESIDGNSIATSTTGAFFWNHGDGRMMEAGSYGIEDNPDLYDPHNMTIVRYANYIDGFDAIYDNFEGIEELFPVYTPLTGISEYEAEALKNSKYKNSTIINIASISLRAFDKDLSPVEPTPGTSKPPRVISDTTEDYPITFNMPFPEIDGVKNGYYRNYYILNFHETDPRYATYEIEKLPIKFDESGTSYSFSAHKFSTFALAYEDIKIPDAPNAGFVSPFSSPLAVRLAF